MHKKNRPKPNRPFLLCNGQAYRKFSIEIHRDVYEKPYSLFGSMPVYQEYLAEKKTITAIAIRTSNNFETHKTILVSGDITQTVRLSGRVYYIASGLETEEKPEIKK